jgi:hypothetical protein
VRFYLLETEEGVAFPGLLPCARRVWSLPIRWADDETSQVPEDEAMLRFAFQDDGSADRQELF